MIEPNPQRSLRRFYLACLAMAAACLFTLTTLGGPALADDTDGGNGQGTGSGGDGCAKSGWRLVNDVDDIEWQDNGYGQECGNTAYVNRDQWTHREFTDNTGANHVCDTRGGSNSSNCNGEWQNANTPLYSALGNMGANACFRRTDVHGIWYLQDAGLEGIKSWTNLGINPDGNHRTVNALKDAIDDSWDTSRHELVDSGTRGDADWWDSRVRDYMGHALYDESIDPNKPPTVRETPASLRQVTKAYLMSTIKDVTGGNNPVILCWYNSADATGSGVTCGDFYSDSQWSNYLHPDGITKSSPYGNNCFRRCSAAQGDYPNSLPHAGEWIPNANGNVRPRPYSNGDNAIADYCYPPIVVIWHQGGYGSTITGIGYTVQGQQGSNTYTAAQPHTYVTSVEDGNGAYDSTSKIGNAPGQGQLTGSTATKKTAFGAFIDKYCGGSASCSSGQVGDPGSASYNQFVADYTAAVNALPSEPHATLDLTTVQQGEVAKGRILNVVERTVYTSAQARRLLDRFYTRVVTRETHYTLTGRERSTETSTSAWTYDPAKHASWNNEEVPASLRDHYRPTFPDGTTFADAHPDIQKWDHEEAVYGTTPKPTGFWQNAVTHCNNQEFATLNPSGEASGTNDTGVLDTGDTSQYYSASAVFKMQDSNYAVNAPAVDFTRARWGATTNNASSKPAFFDRLCYYPGSAAKPTDMTAKTAATQGSFVFLRDGERHLVEGTKGDGDSPFFVPDFRGEDRTTSTTTVTGYKADKSTKAQNASWTVSYEETYQTGSTSNPGTPTTYSGTWRENWTCNIPNNKSTCKPPSGTASACDHQDRLESGTWGPSTTDRNGDRVTTNGGCAERVFTRTATQQGTPASTTPTYGWRAQSATYSTSSAAQSAYNSCVSRNSAGDPGRTRNCAQSSQPEVWSTPTSTSVPSCPMTDTATERYTNCQPITRTDSVTTNYNVVDYQNEDPSQVIVTPDPLSTPDPSLATYFGLANSGGSAKLFSDDPSDTRTPKSEGVYQSQFASSPVFSSSTVAVASGGYKRLEAKGAWASDKYVPQVLTLAWYFTPRVSSTFAVTNVGFGRPGGLMTYSKGQYSTPVRGRVEATANTLGTDDGSTLADHQDEVWANSGTNIEDGLNVPTYYGENRQDEAPYRWLVDPAAASPHYFTVDFRRVVKE